VILKPGLEVTRKPGCDFLFAFHINYGSLSRIILETSEILVKNRDFFIPLLHSTPPLGRSPSVYCLPVWFGKTRMVGLGLADCGTSLTICLPVLTECTNVTDRHTQRHRMTAKAALDASIALQKLAPIC